MVGNRCLSPGDAVASPSSLKAVVGSPVVPPEGAGLARRRKNPILMCGIAGSFGAVDPEPEIWLPRLRHRGPDGEGTWTSPSGRAALAHTRLAIIDPHPEAAQPMSSPCGRWHLVFNGEIYNYRELRAGLEAEGAVFSTRSDTEVLLQGLAMRGCDFLPSLAGMYAFAFWDEQEGSGLLARDPFGIKPLYYRSRRDVLQFASEFRALCQPGDALDGDAARDFLLWGSVPEPRTIHRDIRLLEAGCWMSWTTGPRNHGTMGRWELQSSDLRSPAAGLRSLNDPAAFTRRALLESVSRHLVSDVPVGLFLSGGIDSTAILALAREVLGAAADLRTFSIGFEDPAYDEASLARRTAEHFGTRHTEWRMSSQEGAAEIGAFLAAVDQPCTDGFNTWCVSKLARREGMKVVLSGLGGDEVFAGYKSFRQVPGFRNLYRGSGALRPALAYLGSLAPAGSPWRRLAAFLRGRGSGLSAYQALRGLFTEEEADCLVRSLTGENPGPASWDDPEDGPRDGREMVGFFEMTRYLRNQLLRDSDVFSMAQGLELRVPFVDARLFGSLSKLPAPTRLRQGKQLLLEAVPEVPEWVRRQPKRGFRFPFQEWMEGTFGDQLRQAEAISPFPLVTWYRRWAVTAILQKLGEPAGKGKARQ